MIVLFQAAILIGILFKLQTSNIFFEPFKQFILIVNGLKPGVSVVCIA